MYNDADVMTITQLSDCRLQLNVEYKGNAGEEMVSDVIYVQTDATMTADDVRRLVEAEARRKIRILNNNSTLRDTIEDFLPYNIDLATPHPSPPASTFGAYMAATVGFTPGATPQDVFTISNPGTKKVTLTGAGIATRQTTAGNNPWRLIVRSTLNQNGTSALVGSGPTGAGFPAATAEVRQYTANPTTPGTLVANYWTGLVTSPAPATAGVGNTNVDLTPILQRMSLTIPQNAVVAFNFNGAALPPGLGVVAWFAWTEG